MTAIADNPWAEAPEPLGIPIHPRASIFPMMDDAALDELAADVKAHGLLRPIELVDGAIIDGRNRLVACRRAGVEPTFVDVDDLVRARGATEYVVTSNLTRRHLTIGQRAILAARLKALFEEEAQARQAASRFGSAGAPVREPIEPGRGFREPAAGDLFSAPRDPVCSPLPASTPRGNNAVTDMATSPGEALSTVSDRPRVMYRLHVRGRDGFVEVGATSPLAAAQHFQRHSYADMPTDIVWSTVAQRWIPKDKKFHGIYAIETVVEEAAVGSKGKASEQAAALVAVSTRSVEHASKVVDAGVPELAAAVETGAVTLTDGASLAELPAEEQARILATADPKLIAREAKKHKEAKKAAAAEKERTRRAELAAQAEITAPSVERVDLRCESAAEMLARLDDGIATIIHADPPWAFDDPGVRGGVQTRYQTMDASSILRDLESAISPAIRDAYLLLWVPSSMLDQLVDVTASWRQLAVLVWVKTDGPGTGTHVRNEHELCILYGLDGGKPKPWVQGGPRSVVSAPRTDTHSEKPQDALRAWIGAYAPPNAIVVDLYAGESASCARACLAEGRRYIGAELDPARHARAMERLTQTTPLFGQGGVGDE